MQKLKTFFRTFQKSVLSPQYYADVLKTRLSFSFLYFGFAFFLIGLVLSTGVAGFTGLAASRFETEKVVNQAMENVPHDLVVHIEKGRLSINKPLPYAIALPKSWSAADSETGFALENAVVFDTDDNVKSIDSFKNYHTAVLATETHLYYLSKNSGQEDFEIRVYPLSSIQEPKDFSSRDVFVVKDKVLSSPLVKNRLYVPIIAIGTFVLMLIFVPFFFWLFALVTLAIYSAVLFVIARVLSGPLFKGRKFTYKQIFQVGLHVFVPLLILQWGLNVVGLHGFSGWVFFLAYCVAVTVALRGATAKK